MKPHVKLAETQTPDGATLALYEHDGNYCIRLNGQEVMHSGATSSEILLGQLACEARSIQKSPTILVGGLGLGFTLHRILQTVDPGAKVVVVELLPEVVEWNRTHLLNVNGKLLKDRRVEVVTGDVYDFINESPPERFDSIVLDIDNGPSALVLKTNGRLYKTTGLHKMIDTLKPSGRCCFWSAREDPSFVIRLNKAGFKVDAVPAKLHDNAKRATYTIYVGDL